jgi:hypothetical protein
MLSNTHRNEVARCAGDAKSINVIRVEVDFERGKICYKKQNKLYFNYRVCLKTTTYL